MLGNAIGSFFGLIGSVLSGFWNVLGKLGRLLVFTGLCGAAALAVHKFGAGTPGQDWLYFKGGAFIGLLIGGIRLLINEVAVPLVHAQEQRRRFEARKEFDLQLAKARALSSRESVSNRLKHLH
jgi:hypothetical protein